MYEIDIATNAFPKKHFLLVAYFLLLYQNIAIKYKVNKRLTVIAGGEYLMAIPGFNIMFIDTNKKNAFLKSLNEYHIMNITKIMNIAVM